MLYSRRLCFNFFHIKDTHNNLTVTIGSRYFNCPANVVSVFLCFCKLLLIIPLLLHFFLLPVEKVAVLCRFLDIGAVTKNHLLKYALAHAFCCFLASVEDVNPAVATRARLLLDTIKRPSLQVT